MPELLKLSGPWRHLRAPLATIVPLLLGLAVLPAVPPASGASGPVGRILTVLLILSVAWFFIRLTRVVEEALLERFRTDVADNLQARKVHTQTRILRRIVVVVVGVVALALILMSFETLRRFGTGILASAGLAGIILGLAAQKTLGNLIAGFQIAVTQPIRLDDVVIVEGEWGWIEEITLTYVVVRIWDLRRLVVPITYFIDKPFQNWTRVTADILGTVYIYADYRLPVEEVRAQLHRFLQESPDWDGQVWGLQVTGTGDRTMELRALMSAPDAGTAWNLRCAMREKLLGWLQANYPDCLPRVRAEFGGEAVGGQGDRSPFAVEDGEAS